MAERNRGASCGASEGNLSCPYFRIKEHDDTYVNPKGKQEVIGAAWGYCQRFPKWERKSPRDPACGEHPQYFLGAEYGSNQKCFTSEDGGWFDIRTWQQILAGAELWKAQAEGYARLCEPGEVIPIDGPIKEEIRAGWIDLATGRDITSVMELRAAQTAGIARFCGPGGITQYVPSAKQETTDGK
jgi:hypothetical protein